MLRARSIFSKEPLKNVHQVGKERGRKGCRVNNSIICYGERVVRVRAVAYGERERERESDHHHHQQVDVLFGKVETAFFSLCWARTSLSRYCITRYRKRKKFIHFLALYIVCEIRENLR